MQFVCVYGFSYKETASILEIVDGTVLSQLLRARIAIGEQFIIGEQASSKERVDQLLKSPQESTVTRTNNEQLI